MNCLDSGESLDPDPRIRRHIQNRPCSSSRQQHIASHDNTLRLRSAKFASQSSRAVKFAVKGRKTFFNHNEIVTVKVFHPPAHRVVTVIKIKDIMKEESLEITFDRKFQRVVTIKPKKLNHGFPCS